MTTTRPPHSHETPADGAVQRAAEIISTELKNVDEELFHTYLYLIQSAHLIWFDEPLYANPIQATETGFYVQGLSQKYNEVLANETEKCVRNTTFGILDILQKTSREDLFSRLQEPDTPWADARKRATRTLRTVEIEQKSIKAWHSKYGFGETREPLTEEEQALINRLFDGDPGALSDIFEHFAGVRPVSIEKFKPTDD